MAPPAPALTRSRPEANAPERIVPRIRILGPLLIESATELSSRRASTEELVAYLALQRAGAQRDELVEALWPNSDPVLGRQRLWQSTSEARRLLSVGLLRERDRYRLDRRHVWVDVDRLEALLSEARELGDAVGASECLERAFSFFRGEPLAGSDYLWAEGEVRRLRAVFVDLAGRIAESRLAAQDVTGALSACEAALRVDELSEPLWRLAMEAESRLGLRSAVVARYAALRSVLADRLGLEPERETRALFRTLMAQA
jgi:DNA-binding SARP family transcriptional activator